MDVHGDRFAFLGKYLLQQHPRYFASLNVGVRYEMPVRSIVTGPTKA